MTDAELIARLRYEADTDGYDYHGDLHEKSADRVEALTKERDQHWDSFVHWRKQADDLTGQLAAARQDAKEAEVYAEEVEAKLAKAVEALEDIVKDCEADYPPSHGAIKYFARETLEKLKGESHE